MMCVIFIQTVEQNRRKSLRTKLKIAVVMCHTVDFTGKGIMMDYFFLVQTFLANNTSCILINPLLALFIRYYETSVLFFPLRNSFGILSKPPKKILDTFLNFKAIIITSIIIIQSTETYCARDLIAQCVASDRIFTTSVML